MLSLVVVVLVVLAAAAILIAILSTGGALGKYFSRPCMGRAWKREFPTASKQEIRDFLQAFVDGFAFPAEQRLCFHPGDTVMDIYKLV